eukprot:NODE_155_length_15238_cov_1.162560.p9 type:complete len:181 gc:universal NODE_155_length_15238_cov_1.162560:553-1095(+)
MTLFLGVDPGPKNCGICLLRQTSRPLLVENESGFLEKSVNKYEILYKDTISFQKGKALNIQDLACSVFKMFKKLPQGALKLAIEVQPCSTIRDKYTVILKSHLMNIMVETAFVSCAVTYGYEVVRIVPKKWRDFVGIGDKTIKKYKENKVLSSIIGYNNITTIHEYDAVSIAYCAFETYE